MSDINLERSRGSSPQISKVVDYILKEVTKIPESTEQRIKPIGPEFTEDDELNVDDDYTGSDITDPFEDATNGKPERYTSKLNRRLSKQEENEALLESFTDDFKEVMKVVRNETSSIIDSWDEISIAKLERSPSFELPDYMQKKIEDIFAEIKIPTYEKDDEPKEPEERMDEAMWRQLNTSEDLIISPPGYNAHRQQEPHWLNREPVPEAITDFAQRKCELWMKSNHS